jgi:hypothetical protein
VPQPPTFRVLRLLRAAAHSKQLSGLWMILSRPHACALRELAYACSWMMMHRLSEAVSALSSSLQPPSPQ